MDDLHPTDPSPDATAPARFSESSRNRVVIAAGTIVVVIGVVLAIAFGRGGGSSNNAGATSSGGSSSHTTAPAGNADERTDTSGPAGSGSTVAGGSEGSTVAPGSTGTSLVSPGSTTAGTGQDGTVPTTVKGKGSKNPYIPGGGPFPTNPPETVSPTQTAAYTQGYQAECRKIWRIADRDGLLWDADWLETKGVPVTVCYAQENVVLANTYNSPDDANTGAMYDAIADMSDWATEGTLINTSRTKTWTATDG